MGIFNRHFRHSLIKKYTTVIGSILNDIDVVRYDSNDVEESRIKVPVAQSNKEKFIQRLMGDANLERQPAITLPRIGFELVQLQYNPARKIPHRIQYAYRGQGGTYSLYGPVPYDLIYVAYIAAKSYEDATQIVEQIAPFFTPDFNIEMRAIQDGGLKYDVPITLDSISLQDDAQGRFEERRVLVWTLTFVLKGFLFGPIRGGGNIIKHIDLEFLDTNQLGLNRGDQMILVDVDIEPFIDGVPLEDIEFDDDWVVNTTLTEYI